MSQRFVPPAEFEEYRIVRALGQGGMGQVFLAHDTLLDRPVAVKFIAAANPDARVRQQFFTEARALARLSHPNVVAVHRVGEVRRQPYLVSEFVRGQTLDQLPRPVPAARVIGLAVDLASGLAAAHRRGVLHRDVKPANAIITDEDVAKLLDFGLARLFEAEGGPGAAAVADGGARPAGTPGYIAPELWRGEAPTPAADVFAFGVMLFELLVGHPPGPAPAPAELAEIPPALAEVIGRCLAAAPSQRYPTGAALYQALEALGTAPDGAAPDVPAGNPYPGLASFGAHQRGLFFGRGADLNAVRDRLRGEAFVLVAGDSGVGKSSLCRAGVLPALGDAWRVAALVPGRRPLLALAAAIAHAFGWDEAEVEAALATSPPALAARLARAGPALVFADQLEELVTLAAPAEAERFAEAWAALAVTRPGLRLLAAVRGDFLTRLAGLAPLRELVGPALYMLGPLDAAGVRAAVVDPAARTGVRFESERMVDELADAGARGPGSLPLLQFTLAALWEARDQARRLIPATALAALGGVEGALARHADGVIARMRPAERAAARPLLTRLVTAEGTRARFRRDELADAGGGGDGDRADDGRGGAQAAALEALVRGRLVVVREAEDGGDGSYEIAHEALVTGWETLRGWLAGNAEARAAEARALRAAAEWARLGRPADLLLSRRQLAELDRLAASGGLALGAGARELIAVSRRARRRGRLVAWSAAVAGTLAIGLGMLGVAARARRAQDAAVAQRRVQADAAMARARRAADALAAARGQAFQRFDAGDGDGGEAGWRRALAHGAQREAAWSEAGAALESALAIAPGRADTRGRLADLLLARALAAGEAEGQREGLVARLAVHDDGGVRLRQLIAPARLVVESRPAGATVSLSRYLARDGRLVEGPARALGRCPADTAVEPGSYVLALELPGFAPTRLPVLLARGQRLAVGVDLLPAGAVPAAYLHVPAGRFLYGSADVEELRQFFHAQPLREVETATFLIARHEVTFAEWIAFLDDLPPRERARRRPSASNRSHRLELVRRDGHWVFELAPTGHLYRAGPGEPLRYQGRDRRAQQDWRRFPVGGVSYDDARAYAAWLDRSGRLPGARLCSEHEWERAARGADGRRFPWGERALPDDMNHDRSYGMQLLSFGPDEVGARPDSRSPFGVEDLAGNVFEWTRSSDGDVAITRGGSWRQDETVARAMNREPSDHGLRLPDSGVRLCATPSPPAGSAATRPP